MTTTIWRLLPNRYAAFITSDALYFSRRRRSITEGAPGALGFMSYCTANSMRKPGRWHPPEHLLPHALVVVAGMVLLKNDGGCCRSSNWGNEENIASSGENYAG